MWVGENIFDCLYVFKNIFREYIRNWIVRFKNEKMFIDFFLYFLNFVYNVLFILKVNL